MATSRLSADYVDEQKPRADLPPAKPRSVKGIGGCPFTHPDMETLGISSVTLNIVLNSVIGSEPGPRRRLTSTPVETGMCRTPQSPGSIET